MAHGMQAYEQEIAPRKRALLGGLRGRILELGPGVGPNFPYYAPEIEWIGLEPNPHMHAYLRERAGAEGITQTDFRIAGAEKIDLPDASIDAVVSTLVFCSVPDAAGAMREVLRVLKPGGRFVFVEHVAGERGSGLRRIQAAVRPVFRFCFDGCQPDRETGRLIDEAGFAHVNTLEPPFHVAGKRLLPHIAGTAVK